MDILRVFRAALAHWIVVLAVLVLGIGAAVVLGSMIRPEYQVDSSIILLAPAESVDPSGAPIKVNPYSRFGSSGEGLIATSVVSVINSDSYREGLARTGLTSQYELNVDPGGGGAIISISIIGDTAASALKASSDMAAEVSKVLVQRQIDAGAPSDTLVRSKILTAQDEPTALLTGRLKVVGVIGFATLIAALGAGLLAEWRKPRIAGRRSFGSGPVMDHLGRPDARNGVAASSYPLLSREPSGYRGVSSQAPHQPAQQQGLNEPVRGPRPPARQPNQPVQGFNQPVRGGNQPVQAPNQPVQGSNQPAAWDGLLKSGGSASTPPRKPHRPGPSQSSRYQS